MITLTIDAREYALPENWDEIEVGRFGCFAQGINRMLRETREEDRGEAFELRTQLYALGCYMLDGVDNVAAPLLGVLRIAHVGALLNACAFLFSPIPDVEPRALDVEITGRKYLCFDQLEGVETGRFLDLKAIRERMEKSDDAPWQVLPELLATLLTDEGLTYAECVPRLRERTREMRRMKLLDALALRGFFLPRTIGLSSDTLQSIMKQARATRKIMRAIRSASRPSLWKRITAYGRMLWRMPVASLSTLSWYFRRAPAGSFSCPTTSQTNNDALNTPQGSINDE